MQITYHGHSCFKLKTNTGTVVTDPYDPYVGFSLPAMSADVVTVSHDHKDHNMIGGIKGTARRKTPFIITTPGEYEVQMISVFGVSSWHDASGGVERGQNTIFTIYLDGLRVCHLGDLGHMLKTQHIEAIGEIDILLCPVGGTYTITAEEATKIIHALEPAIAIPMHYKTDQHNTEVFADLTTVEHFLSVYGAEVTPQTKLDISAQKLPEETEIVTLLPQL